jgi:hypothetical protein
MNLDPKKLELVKRFFPTAAEIFLTSPEPSYFNRPEGTIPKRMRRPKKYLDPNYRLAYWKERYWRKKKGSDFAVI